MSGDLPPGVTQRDIDMAPPGYWDEPQMDEPPEQEDDMAGKTMAVTDVEGEISRMVRDVHQDMQRLETETPTAPANLSAAERIGEELGHALLTGARELLSEAEKLVLDDEKFVAHIKAEIARRVQRNRAYMKKLTDYRNANTESRKLLLTAEE